MFTGSLQDGAVGLNARSAIYELLCKTSYRDPYASRPPDGVARSSMPRGGFLLPFCVSGQKWGRYPCHARNGAESHRSFVPFPRVPRRRVLRSVERGVRSPMPRRPRATTTLPLTRPPISPYPREFPLPAGHAESVTVRWAMPADHHEALPSLLYLCDGLRRRRFMWCLHSVLCRSFFFIPFALSVLCTPFL